MMALRYNLLSLFLLTNIAFPAYQNKDIISYGKLTISKNNNVIDEYEITKPVQYFYYNSNKNPYSINPIILVNKRRFILSPIEHIVSFMFGLYDKNQNGFLSYDELRMFQADTDPQIEMSISVYFQICRILGVRLPELGLTLFDFQRSYMDNHRFILGTNATHDLLKVQQYLGISGPSWSQSI